MNSKIYDYFLSSRYIGHTELLKVGAERYDKPFFILNADMNSASKLCNDVKNKNAIPISLENLYRKTAGSNYPVIVDNYAFIEDVENLRKQHNEIVKKIYEEQLEKQDELCYEIKFLNRKYDIISVYLSDAEENVSKLEKQNKRLNNLNIKIKTRLMPTLKDLSKISLWDRIFNYKKKIHKITDDYLF